VGALRSRSLPVLVVDDEPLVRAKLVDIAGVFAEVHAAGSLSEVKRGFAKCRWSCAVIDIGLPDGTGWDVLGVLRDVQPDVNALVLTGGQEPRLRLVLS